MKKNLPYILIVIFLSLFIYQKFFAPKEVIKVPVKVNVPVPVVEHRFDTIKEPVPVYTPIDRMIVDSTYYFLYKDLQRTGRDSLFNEAIKIREYKEIFEDSIQTISIYSKVQGFLKEQQTSYKTKPRDILLDTVIEVKVPFRTRLSIGAEVGFLQNEPMLPKINLSLDTKSIIYSVGVDLDKRVWIGFNYKF